MAKKITDYSEEQGSRRWNDEFDEQESSSEISTFVEAESEVVDFGDEDDNDEDIIKNIKPEDEPLENEQEDGVEAEKQSGKSKKALIGGVLAAVGVGVAGFLGYNYVANENVSSEYVQETQSQEQTQEQVQTEFNQTKEEVVENKTEEKVDDFSQPKKEIEEVVSKDFEEIKEKTTDFVEEVKQEVKEVELPKVEQVKQNVQEFSETVMEKTSTIVEEVKQEVAQPVVEEVKKLVSSEEQVQNQEQVIVETQPIVENIEQPVKPVESIQNLETLNSTQTLYVNQEIKNELQEIKGFLTELKNNIGTFVETQNVKNQEQDVKIQTVENKIDETRDDISSLKAELDALKQKVVSLEEKGCNCQVKKQTNTILNKDKSSVSKKSNLVKPKEKNSIQMIGKSVNIDKPEVSVKKSTSKVDLKATPERDYVQPKKVTNQKLSGYQIRSILNGIAWISDSNGKTKTYTQGDYVGGKQIGSIDVDSGIYDLNGNKIIDIH